MLTKVSCLGRHWTVSRGNRSLPSLDGACHLRWGRGAEEGERLHHVCWPRHLRDLPQVRFCRKRRDLEEIWKVHYRQGWLSSSLCRDFDELWRVYTDVPRAWPLLPKGNWLHITKFKVLLESHCCNKNKNSALVPGPKSTPTLQGRVPRSFWEGDQNIKLKLENLFQTSLYFQNTNLKVSKAGRQARVLEQRGWLRRNKFWEINTFMLLRIWKY